MEIRALRTLRTDAGTVRRDQKVELSAVAAKSLIARGLAEAVEQPGEKPKAQPKAKPKAKGEAPAPEGE